MKVEALKEKARRHEQKEEWQKALDLYKEALQKTDPDEPPDITLYNRVGDIQTRVGQIDAAVESYEKAIDLYLEAELPNNAIAVCKKVLRNLPDRSLFFLRMGQIRGAQGFLTDARQNFLTFAEQMTTAGDLNAAMDALVEFVALSPEDLEIRLGLASQLETHQRVEEAVGQYMEGYRRLVLQDRDDEAEAIAGKIRELAPDAMLPDAQSIRAGSADRVEEVATAGLSGLAGIELGSGIQEEPTEAVAEVEAEFGEIQIAGDAQEEEGKEAEAPTPEPAMASQEETGDFEIAGGLGEDAEEEAEALPTFGLASEGDEGEAEAEPLPTFGFDESGDEGEEEAEPLPTFGFDEESAQEEEAGEPLPTFGFGEEMGEVEESAEEDMGEPLPTMTFHEEDDEAAEEEAEPLPMMGFGDEGEAVSADTPSEAEDQIPALAAEDFGVADHGDRESREYVEAEEAPPELEVPLEDLTLEEATSPAEKALEGAMEDAVFEAAVDSAPATSEEPSAPPAEEPASVAPVESPVAPPVEETPAARPPANHAEAAERGDLPLAMELLRAQIAANPDAVDLHQRLVEYAFRMSDHAVLIPAYMELAACLTRTNAPAKAKAIYQQVLSLSPGHEGATSALAAVEGATTGRKPVQVASSEEYVDLGSMILGEGEEKTTRWQVTADAPSGDEQADFAKMLSQFKEKVAEHVDADDVSAHHDLGTAYMEMGLLDEAISEFQMALRASPDHLPTHEVMGRCWMEMGKPDMAARALNRALENDPVVEDEFIGIYYLMGRAQEDLGNTSDAVEFYDKVFSLDINFEDVTERLRALREDSDRLLGPFNI